MGIGLYTRIPAAAVLRNTIRSRVYERVREEPAIHQAAIANLLGIGNGTARYHLDKLASHHLVYAMNDGHHVRFYASGSVPPTAARQIGALKTGSLRRVYNLLVAEPQLSLREAGSRLGMAAPSVWRAKKRLEREGLLPARASVEPTPAQA